MPNAYFQRGKAVCNASEQFDRQKQLKGQAKIVSDGHESIYWINKVIYMCFDGNFLFWWKFFVLMEFFFSEKDQILIFFFDFLKVADQVWRAYLTQNSNTVIRQLKNHDSIP